MAPDQIHLALYVFLFRHSTGLGRRLVRSFDSHLKVNVISSSIVTRLLAQAEKKAGR